MIQARVALGAQQRAARRLSRCRAICPSTHGSIATIGDLLEQVARGELHVEIDRSFTLADAAAAHGYVESRTAFGRVIMTP